MNDINTRINSKLEMLKKFIKKHKHLLKEKISTNILALKRRIRVVSE